MSILMSINQLLKYFKNTEVDICNILVMTEDFNIRDRDQNLSYPHYSAHNDILMKTSDFFVEHVTWKLCDRVQNGLEGLRVQKNWDNVKGLWFLMVYTWCTHVQRRLRV